MLAGIEKGAQRIERLVSEMLNFARISREHQLPIRIHDVVMHTLEFCRYQCQGANVRVVTDVPTSLPRISGAPDQLELVFINLLVNAVQALQAMPSEAERILRVDGRQEGGDVVVTIRDNGPGMEPAVRDRLFEPFFTTKPGGSGTGLGLATSLLVVQRHNGAITVESTPGAGAAFHVRLPAVVEPEAGPAPDRG
jgi:signal transduction histidine kinase